MEEEKQNNQNCSKITCPACDGVGTIYDSDTDEDEFCSLCDGTGEINNLYNNNNNNNKTKNNDKRN